MHSLVKKVALIVVSTFVLSACGGSGGGSGSGSNLEMSNSGMQILNADVSGVYKGRNGENIEFSHEVLISYSFEEDEENPLAPGIVPVSIIDGELRVLKGACLALDILDEGSTLWALEIATSDFSPALYNHNCDQTLQTVIGRDAQLMGHNGISFPEDTTIKSFGGTNLIGSEDSEDFYFDNGLVTIRNTTQ